MAQDHIHDLCLGRNQSFQIRIYPIEPLRRHYTLAFSSIANDFQLTEAHFEELFSWLIKEAISLVLAKRNLPPVFQHVRHDVYRCIYVEFPRYLDITLEHHVASLIEDLHLNHQNRSDFQAMVSGNALIVSFGIYRTPRLD